MAFQNTKHGFIDYRYYKPKFYYAKKIALKFEVNQDTSVITFTCAICTEEDNFCRATAREITDKRFAAGDVYTGMYNRELSIVDNIKQITQIIANGNDPEQPPTGSKRIIKQLNEAFEEVDIAKIIDESGMLPLTDF